MEHRFWILRLQFILLVLLQVAAFRGAVPTTPSGKGDNTNSRTDTEAETLQNQATSNNTGTFGPTLRPYQDFPGGTGVGSWQEISMYPTKETRNGRTLADTNAQGLSSASPSDYSCVSTAIQLAAGLLCLTFNF